MEMKRKYFAIFLFLWVFLIIITGCEYKIPQAIWQPQGKGTPNPIISQVDPPRWAFAGVTSIKITGQNFSENVENNSVYFNNKRGTILSCTPTEILVKAPYLKELIKDSLKIQISVEKAYLPAIYFPYQLKEASVLYGDFDSHLDVIFSIAVDANEDVYAMMKGKTVVKISPNGTKDEEWGSTVFPKASQMRVGPDGYLYLQRSNNQSLYRIAPEGGKTVEWVKVDKKVRFFDFDEYHNIYLGGTVSGIFVVYPDGTYKATNMYEDYDIKAIRVYDNYLYVLAYYKGSDINIPSRGIWRSRISDAQGNLTNPELVVDWSTTGNYAAVEFYDLTFASDGDMYVGTAYRDPILVVHPDGSTEPLYPGTLIPDADQLVWGNANYMYVNRTGSSEIRNLVRIDMNKEGAIYYGRR